MSTETALVLSILLNFFFLGMFIASLIYTHKQLKEILELVNMLDIITDKFFEKEE